MPPAPPAPASVHQGVVDTYLYYNAPLPGSYGPPEPPLFPYIIPVDHASYFNAFHTQSELLMQRQRKEAYEALRRPIAMTAAVSAVIPRRFFKVRGTRQEMLQPRLIRSLLIGHKDRMDRICRPAMRFNRCANASRMHLEVLLTTLFPMMPLVQRPGHPAGTMMTDVDGMEVPVLRKFLITCYREGCELCRMLD